MPCPKASSNVLRTDAPVDNNGRGETFSPTDLVATALGTCMLTIMGMLAERHDWDLSRATVRVTKHMVADPKRRIGRPRQLYTGAGNRDYVPIERRGS